MHREQDELRRQPDGSGFVPNYHENVSTNAWSSPTHSEKMKQTESRCRSFNVKIHKLFYYGLSWSYCTTKTLFICFVYFC